MTVFVTGATGFIGTHIVLELLSGQFVQSYKEIPDEKMQEVMDYIDFLVENPS